MQNHDQNDHKPPKQSWILYAKLRKPSTDVSLWPDSDTYSFIPSASRCKRLIGKAFSYEIRLANSSCSSRAIQFSIYATSFHRLSVPAAPGSHTLLSARLSHVFPLWVTRSPLAYGFVLLGCSHSGTTDGSGINTFAHKDGDTSGAQLSCAVCPVRHLYKTSAYCTRSPAS